MKELQGGEWCKMNDCVASDKRNNVSCSEKTRNMNEKSEHTDKMFVSNAAVKDPENLDSTEVVIEGKFDSGFSWVIVCASFINCFTVGVMFIGFSILYVEISEYFDSSKGVAGWIGSLYMASGNIFGEKSHSLCSFICCLRLLQIFAVVSLFFSVLEAVFPEFICWALGRVAYSYSAE